MMVSVSISFRLSSEERQTLETIAEMMGISISEVLRDAIKYYIQHLKKNNKIRQEIKETAQWKQYRKETKEILQKKLWYWNAYRLIRRLREEGVPDETLSELIKEIGGRMKAFDPQQAERFRRLILGMGVK